MLTETAQNRRVKLEKILVFLDEIGIQVIEKELTEKCFLPGLSLAENSIHVDYERLLYPGDILHEAGHLAVTTAAERAVAGTENMAKNWPSLGEEIGAILWSYAALRHLELPLEFVFHSHGYKGCSDWYISTLNSGNYIGLPFLEWVGLALSEKRAETEGKKAFPAMQKWLRD